MLTLGVSVLHYLQAVNNKLALGGEVAYQYGPGIPGGGIAVMSGVGRYTGMLLIVLNSKKNFTSLISKIPKSIDKNPKELRKYSKESLKNPTKRFFNN